MSTRKRTIDYWDVELPAVASIFNDLEDIPASAPITKAELIWTEEPVMGEGTERRPLLKLTFEHETRQVIPRRAK